MKKRLLSILLAIIAALSLALCSCGDPAPKGKLYTLEHAYNDGLITIDDFLDIAYHGNVSLSSPAYALIDGDKMHETIDINYTSSKEIVEFTDETRREIATVAFDSYPEFFENMMVNCNYTKESIINEHLIVKSLGEYNGNYAVLLFSEYWEYITLNSTESYKINIMHSTVNGRLDIDLRFVGPVGLCIYSYR